MFPKGEGDLHSLGEVVKGGEKDPVVQSLVKEGQTGVFCSCAWHASKELSAHSPQVMVC